VMMTNNRFLKSSLSALGCGVFAVVLSLGCSSNKTPAESPESASGGDTTGSQNANASRNNREMTLFLSDEVRRICDLPEEPGQAPLFDYDDTSLRARGRNVLDDVATCLKDGPLKGRNVTVIGRTDPRGPADYNQQLGKSRADAARDYLVDRGVAPAQLEVRSRGEQGARGNDEESWALDRRVDLELNGDAPANSGAEASGAGSTGAATAGSGSSGAGASMSAGAKGSVAAGANASAGAGSSAQGAGNAQSGPTEAAKTGPTRDAKRDAASPTAGPEGTVKAGASGTTAAGAGTGAAPTRDSKRQ